MSRWISMWMCVLPLAGGSVVLAESPAEVLQREAARLVAETDQMTIPGQDGWLFLRSELRHLAAGPFWGERAAEVTQAPRPEFADPLPIIIDFHQQLEALNIELLLVPVPPKALIYPDRLLQDGGVSEALETAHQRFYDLLREQGVNVLDLTETLREAREDARGPTYCRTDSHWSGVGVVVAAQQIAAQLTGRPWLQTDRAALQEQWDEVTIEGDLLRALPEPRPAAEAIALRTIRAGGGAAPQPSRESPIILLGDSHTLVFHAGEDMHARGAGLADQLAFELGMPVDLHGVRGSGATPARINLARAARAQADYLAGKRLVIWCFAAREFTESDGWRPVPIAPPGN
jgi:hypothetical protein